MMLKIKQEFKNSVITRRVPNVGVITFNASTADPKYYEMYKRYGFDIFEYEPTVFKYQAVEQEDIKPVKPKRKRKPKNEQG
jgi:hypothetical protein